jgi:hypothetical protein
MENQNVIELRRYSQNGGFWGAYHLGPHAKRITELFGTPMIPTAFTDKTEPERVRAAIQKLNPGVDVRLEACAYCPPDRHILTCPLYS